VIPPAVDSSSWSRPPGDPYIGGGTPPSSPAGSGLWISFVLCFLSVVRVAFNARNQAWHEVWTTKRISRPDRLGVVLPPWANGAIPSSAHDSPNEG
jgi:hypothetical protein